MKMYSLIVFLFSFVFAQDDLFDLINDEPEEVEYVEYAFKGTRVANAQSLEIPKPKVLQFMIQHRFGSIENGFYDLFGTDYAIIRYDFSYGFNDVFALGLGRSSFDKIYDIFLKTKLLRQSKGGRYKITSRFSINGDYFIPIGSRSENFKNSFAIGFDYETGGHVFQVMISNAHGPYELTFIENANGDISDSRLYLGFNISRAFSLKGKDSNSW